MASDRISEIVVAVENRKYFRAIEYTWRILLDPYGVRLRIVAYSDLSHPDSRPLLISYGKSQPPVRYPFHIHIYESDLFGPTFLSSSSLPRTPLQQEDGLPLLYSAESHKPLREEKFLAVPFDVVASAFFMVSRYEEWVLDRRDELGRFQARDSFAFQQGFLERPVVDEYSRWLQRLIRSLGLRMEERRRFGDFAIALSHDIDTVSSGWLEAIKHELLHPARPKVTLKNLARIIETRLHGRDLYFNFDDILELERAYDARSTFFILKRTGDRRDAKYDYRSKLFREVFARMLEGGWEIGLHGSFRSVVERASLADEKRALEAALGAQVAGNRQHFLRMDVAHAWRTQQRAGLRYDATLGYADAAGFRAGLARPFHPFDVKNLEPFSIVEVPLVIMDGSYQKYGGLDAERVWSRVIPLLEEIKRHHGAASVLWHNTFFTPYKFRGYREVYVQLLKWVREQGGELTTCQRVAERLHS